MLKKKRIIYLFYILIVWVYHLVVKIRKIINSKPPKTFEGTIKGPSPREKESRLEGTKKVSTVQVSDSPYLGEKKQNAN